MNLVTERDIGLIVKKHLGFTLMLAVVPILFLLLISFFETQANSLIPFVSPISTIAAVSYFLKNVLTDVYANNKA
jgi:hypothetical protein